ncbi:MAG: glycosyltransferase family 39 protein [Chloroflexi bacterium]|nr:glycosyltransferase family 39 protein [Chloroflexota bacterium]
MSATALHATNASLSVAHGTDQNGAWLSPRVRLVTLAFVLVVAALFRLPLLDRIPNGLFLDEASRGYDAYSLSRTGRDQYGVAWPLFAEGLDDYTPGLYTYLTVPFVAALGPTPLAVRLPAALAGIATVGLTYGAVAAFFGAPTGLVAAALLATSPWHILPSRTGAEWILLPLFTTAGVWSLAAGRQRGPALVLAGAMLGMGLYSYAFARVLEPLLVAGFALVWWRALRPHWCWALTGLLVFAILALPVVQFGLTPEGQTRLRTVVPLDRYPGFALIPYVLANFVSYFAPWFLVWGSEPTHHHRLAGFGPILPFMVPLVTLGLLAAIRRPARPLAFWLWWIVAAPASAALHRESPSSLLLLGAIPAWQALAAVGAVSGIVWLAERGVRLARVAALAGLVAATITAGLAARALYLEYPVYAADDWEYGAAQVVQFLEAERSGYDGVLVSDRLDTPHILVLFFAQFDPVRYQQAPIHVSQPNVRSRGEIGVYRFGKISDVLDRPGRYLVWVTPAEGQHVFPNTAPLLTVALPTGEAAHFVYDVERH